MSCLIMFVVSLIAYGYLNEHMERGIRELEDRDYSHEECKRSK